VSENSWLDDIEKTLAHKREIHVVGLIDPIQAYVLVKHLRYLVHVNHKRIRVYLNTQGGSVVDGLAIYDHVRQIARIAPIEMIANGVCMSMGVIILQAATQRIALPNTRFLLHELQTQQGGSLSDVQDVVTEAGRLQVVLDSILAERTGQDIKKLRKTMKRRDYYLDAKEALKYGLIDEIQE